MDSMSDIAAEIDRNIMNALGMALLAGGVDEAADYVLERVHALAAECLLPTTAVYSTGA